MRVPLCSMREMPIPCRAAVPISQMWVKRLREAEHRRAKENGRRVACLLTLGVLFFRRPHLPSLSDVFPVQRECLPLKAGLPKEWAEVMCPESGAGPLLGVHPHPQPSRVSEARGTGALFLGRVLLSPIHPLLPGQVQIASV